ncbi:MAG TPA: helix-turn-helix transcriptional regulator [Solirubrobacteraceae bacterium]|nr:helix-turn-helix transcriptional regulator [Solirubrobacteraceae bacterium]
MSAPDAIRSRSAPDPALATTLRRIRERRGVTREALAFQSGITAGALARIELAQAVPRWNTVRLLAQALNVSMVELSAAVEASATGSRAFDAFAAPAAAPGATQQDRARHDRGEGHDS